MNKTIAANPFGFQNLIKKHNLRITYIYLNFLIRNLKNTKVFHVHGFNIGKGNLRYDLTYYEP